MLAVLLLAVFGETPAYSPSREALDMRAFCRDLKAMIDIAAAPEPPAPPGPKRLEGFAPCQAGRWGTGDDIAFAFACHRTALGGAAADTAEIGEAAQACLGQTALRTEPPRWRDSIGAYRFTGPRWTVTVSQQGCDACAGMPSVKLLVRREEEEAGAD